MRKKSVLRIILDLVFLIVFNTVFFVASGTDHTASVWISYGFIHLAYLMVLITPFLIRKNSSDAVFGFSLYSISSTYFLLEFIIGLAFIFMKSESYKMALIIQVIVTGIYAVFLLSHLIANEHTAGNVESHKGEVTYIKDTTSRVRALVGKANDKKANKEIEKAYDALRSSPSKSAPTAHFTETNIIDKISKLEEGIADQNTAAIITAAGEIVALVEERNRKIRLFQ